MYGIILLYSLINMSVIVENFKMEKKIICVQSTWDVLFWQIYTFIFVKWQMKELLWKAAHRFRATGKGTIRILFDADKKYDQTVHILHDVNKHIKAIEGLYGAEQGNTAGEYAAEIRELLKPLIPVQYTENPILNILLTDKESVMKEKVFQ